MNFILKYLGGFLIPWWVAPVSAVVIAASTYWYVDHSARVEERAAVKAAHTIEMAAQKDAAEKHFAERARIAAAAIAALEKTHAADLAERDRKEDDLEDAWRTAVGRNNNLATNVCWPANVVKELRR